MRRILWWISTCSAILFAAGSVLFFTQGNAWHRRFDEWLVARPIEIGVDLSAPGTYEGPLRQTCSIAHAEVFELMVGGPGPPDARPLDGFAGTLRIADARGNEVLSETYPSTSEILGPRAEGVRLFRVIPFAEGKYRLSLDVTSGAPALAGKSQRLVARYELCGLERMPGTIAYGFSVACLLVALVIGSVLLAVRACSGRPTPSLDSVV